MKCRKCGHVIDIQSAVVPESIRAPLDAGDDDEEDRESAAPDEEVRQNVPKATQHGIGPAVSPPRRTGAGASAPKRAGAPTPAPKRAVAAPPRRGGAAAVAQAIAEKTSPTIDEAVVPATPVAEAPPPKNEFEEDAPTRIHDGTALTAAFSFAMGESAAQPPSASIAEEWYVGIEGTPTGPLTLAQLREKAQAGKATLESLVWKDGFEDWKPIRDFPELAALVEEAKPIVQTVVVAPEPTTLRPAEERKITLSDVPSDVLAELGAKQRKGTSHPAAWAAVIVAMLFGVTVGIVLFSKTEKQEIVKYVEVQASAKAAEDHAPEAAQEIAGVDVSGGTTKHTGVSSVKTENTPAPTPSAAKGLSGLSGLTGLSGLGPSTGGPDVAKDVAPGGQLDGASIQRVVGNFTPSVRRGCWDSAIAARAPDAPSSARVGVSITISPSGNVDNVTTTGDPKGYPGLARCIESKVRGWRFPRSSGTTTAQVPFVFAAQ